MSKNGNYTSPSEPKNESSSTIFSKAWWFQIVLGSLIRPDPHTYIPNTFWQVLEQDLEVACREHLLHRKVLKIRHIEYDLSDQNCGRHLGLNLQRVELCAVSHQCSKTLLLLVSINKGQLGFSSHSVLHESQSAIGTYWR